MCCGSGAARRRCSISPCARSALDGGVMITGSHNPADYNGFKMMLGQEVPSTAPRSSHIAEIAAPGQTMPAARGARSRTGRMLDDYVRAAGCGLSRPAGRSRWSGTPATAPRARPWRCWPSKLPGRHVLLYETIDGSFPNHHPDPDGAGESQAIFRPRVIARRRDLGIAFDGDGDRIGVVDGEGEILWGDQLMVLYARECWPSSPAPRSSPTSRRARCCSTRSRGPAASR